jgi:outer membrane protein assembly factor BamB
MKKLIALTIVLFFSSFCTQKGEKVEKIIEDGVEVVINHIEPYKISGEPNSFILEEKCIIDTERDDVAELGLNDITAFDVDSEENIYFLNIKSTKNLILKFDRNGNLLTSFGRKGQGPGEVQWAPYMKINSQDEIVITDAGKKVIIFNEDGSLVKEIPIDSSISRVTPLDNGGYLIFKSIMDPSADYIEMPLILCNSELEELKELDRYKLPNFMKTRRRKGTEPVYVWSESKGNIYVGNEERGYEIWVYNLKGNLVRKIRKEFKNMLITEEYKNNKLKILSEPMRKMTYFSESFPAFQSFFTDDSGRLFVMTYERDESLGEYIFDIFNPDGAFIGRKNIRALYSSGLVWAVINKGNLYYIQEKESGYKELVVYKLTWEN